MRGTLGEFSALAFALSKCCPDLTAEGSQSNPAGAPVCSQHKSQACEWGRTGPSRPGYPPVRLQPHERTQAKLALEPHSQPTELWEKTKSLLSEPLDFGADRFSAIVNRYRSHKRTSLNHWLISVLSYNTDAGSSRVWKGPARSKWRNMWKNQEIDKNQDVLVFERKKWFIKLIFM